MFSTMGHNIDICTTQSINQSTMKHYLAPPLPTEAVYYTPKGVISEIELKSIIKNPEYNHGNKKETSNTAQTATDIYTMLSAGGFKVLVACEESQTVCKAFRALGIEAYSCDLQEPSGGKPEWHIVGDAVKEAYSGKYDMMIAHPPCTYMSRAGARWMYPTAGNLCQDRYAKAMEAKAMFLELLNAPIEFIAIENPLPLKVVGLPKETQVIQPYEYGHEYSKRTHLWLKGLPELKHTKIVEPISPFLPSGTSRKIKTKYGVERDAKMRSKTFQGIAQEMAIQWAGRCDLVEKN